eukprot:5548546-Prymnesium_polylepis.1
MVHIFGRKLVESTNQASQLLLLLCAPLCRRRLRTRRNGREHGRPNLRAQARVRARGRQRVAAPKFWAAAKEGTDLAQNRFSLRGVKICFHGVAGPDTAPPTRTNTHPALTHTPKHVTHHHNAHARAHESVRQNSHDNSLCTLCPCSKAVPIVHGSVRARWLSWKGLERRANPNLPTNPVATARLLRALWRRRP